VDSTLAGRITGYDNVAGRIKTKTTSTVTPSQTTSSSEVQTGVNPFTGADTLFRVGYSSTGAPLYPRIGDQFNL
jgi:hypothetical protein